MNNKLSNVQLAKFKAIAKANPPAKEIMQEFGISKDTVYKYKRKLGLKGTKGGPELQHKLKALNEIVSVREYLSPMRSMLFGARSTHPAFLYLIDSFEEAFKHIKKEEDKLNSEVMALRIRERKNREKERGKAIE